MKEIKVRDWDHFEEVLRDIKNRCQRQQINNELSTSELLFRGQGNSEWPLETTLDRFFISQVTLIHYYEIILAAKPQIETFTGLRWTIPTLEKYKGWINTRGISISGKFKAYEYLSYLRHNGFPSPLLDWTISPYIAAFFAFNKRDSRADYVSIFIFWEYPCGFKSATGGSPTIDSLGPYVRSHKRHFLQQSQYTVCTVHKKEGLYCSRHEDIVDRNDQSQDLLWKINIPIGEQKKVLKKLSEMNINAFSLFGSEESLIETIATTDILLKGRNL